MIIQKSWYFFTVVSSIKTSVALKNQGFFHTAFTVCQRCLNKHWIHSAIHHSWSSQHFRSVKILPDGTKALSGCQDKSFRVWDLDTSAYLKQDGSRGHSEDVMDIAVTNDGSRCVSSSMDGTLKIWKCDTAEECFNLRGIYKFLTTSDLNMIFGEIFPNFWTTTSEQQWEISIRSFVKPELS